MRFRTLVLVATAALLPWCLGAGSSVAAPVTLPAPGGTADSVRPLAPAADGAAARVAASGDSLAARAERLQRVVEALRGSKFLRPVPVAVVDDSTARVHFLARLEKFWAEGGAETHTRAYTQLGLLPAHTDLAALLLDLLQEQAGGYYDPDADTFFVLADMPASIVPILMVHELTHALDDQHFDIDGTLARLANDDDAQTAFGAIVEGSGTLVMSVFALHELQAGRISPESLVELAQTDAGRAARLRAAPRVVQRALLAPYLVGQAFLLRGHPERVALGLVPADADSAFRDPPRSSEQLLHPEKYWEASHRDLPRVVPQTDLGTALGPGWRRVGDGTLGELLVGLLAGAADPALESVEAATPASWTSSAAAGWGGDRWWLYSDGDRALTVLATLWDSERDAAEFHAALQLPEDCRAWRRRDAVVLVAAAPADRREAVARACLEALGGR